MLKFSCEKALLQLAVNTASRTVATKSSIPGLEGLLLEGTEVLTLSGYNMQTGIRTRLEADIREQGRIVLNSRLFGDIIRKMPDDVIVFSADEKYMVTLTCGETRFEILGLSADDYPEMPEVEKICEDSEEPITVSLGKRHLLFETGSTELICRKLEGEFLDYKNAIPRNNPIRLLVDTKTMLSSLDRVSVVISEKLKSPVRCVMDKNIINFSAKTGNGEAEDVCVVEGDGQGLEIGFNNRYLMDALRFAPADQVIMELNTGISPCVLTPVDGGDNFLYMVLPVRLKA